MAIHSVILDHFRPEWLRRCDSLLVLGHIPKRFSAMCGLVSSKHHCVSIVKLTELLPRCSQFYSNKPDRWYDISCLMQLPSLNKIYPLYSAQSSSRTAFL